MATITDQHGALIVKVAEEPSKQIALIALIKGIMSCEGKGESTSCKKMLTRCFDYLLCIKVSGSDILSLLCRVLIHIHGLKQIEEQSLLKMLKRVI